MPMSSFVQNLTKTTLLKRGIHRHRILLDWHTIMGGKLADLSCPIRITRPRDSKAGGTLHLQVLSGASLLIDSSRDLICERINRHYGYKVVEYIKIIQTSKFSHRPDANVQKKNEIRKADTHLAPALSKTLNDISNPELRQALKDFAQTFQAKS